MSTDLKYTVLALGDFHSVSEIEALTGVSRRQIYRIRENWETTGYVEPEHAGRKTGRPRFLTKDEEMVSSLPCLQRVLTGVFEHQYVVECVQRTPDIYLEDLQLQIVADLGIKISRKLIWETLRRNGLTMKKVCTANPFRSLKATNVPFQASHVAAERSALKRAEYLLRISQRYTRDQLVFADETSFDRRVAHRRYAWALKGQKATKKVLLCRGQRWVVSIPTLGHSVDTPTGTRCSQHYLLMGLLLWTSSKVLTMQNGSSGLSMAYWTR